MDCLERRVFMSGLRIDFDIVDAFPRMREPTLCGWWLLPAYRGGELDAACARGGI